MFFISVTSLRLSLSVYPSVFPTRHPLDGFPWAFILGTFMRICPWNPTLLKIGQKYQSLYTKTYARLYCWQQYEISWSSITVQREPILTFPRQHWTLLYCWQIHTGEQLRKLMSHFHGNNGNMKGPQCYVTLSLSSYVLRLARGTRSVETELRLHTLATILPYFSIDNAHLMYNAHPKLFRHSFWCIGNAHDAN